MKKTLVMLLAMWITASVWGKDIWIGCYDGAYVMNDKFEVTQHYYQDRTIEFDESLLQQGGYELEVTPFNVGK